MAAASRQPARKPARRAAGAAAELERRAGNVPEDRQSQLKLLIARGKEQGYLTYAEVNDHLPAEIVDPEQIEDIVDMINDMGIPVYEKAPDAESLLLPSPRRRPTTKPIEEAAAALARGRRRVRPHDRPGAHVHARDGHGRAADARRRDPHRQAHRGRPRPGAHCALASYPPTLRATCCSTYEPVKAGQGRLVDIIVGFIDPNAPDVIAQPLNPTKVELVAEGEKPRTNEEAEEDDAEDEEALETGPDPEEVARRIASIRKTCTRSARRRSPRRAREDRRRCKRAQEAGRRVHGAQARRRTCSTR